MGTKTAVSFANIFIAHIEQGLRRGGAGGGGGEGRAEDFIIWRFHCNIHYVHINSIFVGIRLFQHLNLSLVHFDPRSDA